MTSRNYDYDVIIIGAGIAGLTAAYSIHERDSTIPLLVLEANDRVGGRVQGIELNAGKKKKSCFDLGGQFVCRSQTHLMNLLNKLDIELEENHHAGLTIGDMGIGRMFKSDTVPPIFGDPAQVHEMTQFLSTLEILSNRVTMENPTMISRYTDLDSTTMEEFMNTHLKFSLPKQYLRVLIKTICGAEPSDISVLFFVCYCNSTEGVTNPYLRSVEGGKGAWIKNGATQICEKIAQIIGEDNIKTNNPVIGIQRNFTDVIIRTAEADFKCKHAIMAVPPLELARIHFFPPLNPQIIEILKKMVHRSRIKFIVTYQNEFWKESGYNGDIYCLNKENEVYPIMWAYNISANGTAVITGLLDVQYNPKKASYKGEVLNHLQVYFGPLAAEPLDYAEKVWTTSEQPFEGYAASFPLLKTMRTFHEIRRPLGRLYFAGAETATYWYGHIAGAAQSGFRAALELLYDLRPQTLTAQDFIDLKPRRKLIQFYSNDNDPLPLSHDWMAILFVSSVVSYIVLKVITILRYFMRIFENRVN